MLAAASVGVGVHAPVGVDRRSVRRRERKWATAHAAIVIHMDGHTELMGCSALGGITGERAQNRHSLSY